MTRTLFEMVYTYLFYHLFLFYHRKFTLSTKIHFLKLFLTFYTTKIHKSPRKNEITMFVVSIFVVGSV